MLITKDEFRKTVAEMRKLATSVAVLILVAGAIGAILYGLAWTIFHAPIWISASMLIFALLGLWFMVTLRDIRQKEDESWKTDAKWECTKICLQGGAFAILLLLLARGVMSIPLR